MNTLTIKTSDFSVNTYHDNNNIDVYNEIIINDQPFWAVYQTGCSYLHNDYNQPNPALELSDNGGSNYLLVLISRLYASDFDTDYINDVLLEAKELCSDIDTIEKLKQVYDALNENLPILEHYI